ncbi:MAG: GspE/PulE family protein [Acidimicrobiales bacterium]
MLGRIRLAKRSAPADQRSVNFGSDTASIEAEIELWERIERPSLGDVLLAQGVVTNEQLAEAEEVEATTGMALADVLLGNGLLNDHTLASALAVQFQIPRADLRNERPEPEAIDRVGEELARKYDVMPLFIDEHDRVFLATAEPLNTEAIEELTLHCKRIGLMIGSRADIERLIDQSYTVLRSAAQHIKAFELVDAEEEAIEETETLVVDENAPIVQVVNRILMQGVRARASDIHIEPEEDYVRVRYRIDGALSEAIRLPRRMGAPISSRIKVMAELNIVERRRPQDGQFSLSIDRRPVDVRTSVVGTMHGEKIVLRLLDKTRSLIGLDQLGMPPEVVAPYLEIVKSPLGMLLCTGPTGSGKTTTLYATLTEVNDVSRNVVTIEDPVEYQFPGVNQMPISEAAGITFADGLRGILRQDPDTILVGEIRDIETARIATQAALTGHFVLSSLHAVDAVSAVHRFTDMGIEPFLVASAISGVVGQRLLRRVCDECRVEYEPSSDHIKLVESSHGSVPDVWTHGVGCNVCSGTGYSGRVGVYELLKVTDEIRDEIVNKATAREIRATAMAQGMRTMQQEAFRLVAEGLTTVDDVLRSVYAPGMDAGDDADVGDFEPRPLRPINGNGNGNGHSNGSSTADADDEAAPSDSATHADSTTDTATDTADTATDDSLEVPA